MKAAALVLTMVAGACGAGAPSATPGPDVTVPPPPTQPAPTDAAGRVAAARTRLADPAQAVRDAAGAELRTLLAGDPRLAGGTEASWQSRLASIKPGTPASELAALLGVAEEGALPNGNGPIFRLDDAWTVTAYVTGGGLQARPVPTPTLVKFGPLEASSRAVWVEPSADYRGRWVTYFANGQVANDFDYVAGALARVTSFYDNGQEAYTQRYVGGVADGTEAGFHRDGSKAYVIQRAGGESVGTWTHWYPDGQKQLEQTYVAGKLDGVSTGWRADGSKDYEMRYAAGVETGQAAWDEHGKLLYAHGTAATP